ncbi:helix-turn-helix domain-containing protein [Enterovirga rhinocerotis]|uniref:helix-turn-helix domain-containing protein n=1 Tax=Enterovirga rhinocerotis TaxID=1339210 RepID=UPI00105ECF12|nr:helix-turn-helix transcriptional regulator [Enterovirga rhinocerotis]
MTHPLRRFRKSENLTIEQIAGRAGLSKATVSRIERDLQKTTEATIRRLIQASEGKLTANDFIATSEAAE